MEWLKRLQGRVIGLDTAPLIYFVERNEIYLTLVRSFFQAIDRGEFQAVTSTLTLTEVLVHPIRSNNLELAGQYRDIILESDNLLTIPISVEISEIAARLRATSNLRTPDALQIATALQGGASFFLTNDIRLAAVPDLEVIVLDTILNDPIEE
jgi:predicted nucleic acid-binding protein